MLCNDLPFFWKKTANLVYKNSLICCIFCHLGSFALRIIFQLRIQHESIRNATFGEIFLSSLSFCQKWRSQSFKVRRVAHFPIFPNFSDFEFPCALSSWFSRLIQYRKTNEDSSIRFFQTFSLQRFFTGLDGVFDAIKSGKTS